MCMSIEGVEQLKNYFSAEGQQVFEPLFIAQYLLAPVNTIVKNSLLPWMMEQVGIPAEKNLNDKNRGRKIKAEVFLKYSLLVELMKLLKKYGRNDDYNFETDEKLACIRFGKHSDQHTTNRTKIILGINSFTAIWLLTLPEKFQEWFEQRNTLSNAINDVGPTVFFTGIPTFPHYTTLNINTSLTGRPDKNRYEFLPDTWNLMDCFEYYYKQ